jgi:uncharacterized membrane protein YqhA
VTDGEHQGDVRSPAPRAERSWAVHLFSSSRFFAIFAVFGAFLAAVTLYIYGTVVAIQEILHTLGSDRFSVPGMQRLQAAFIEMTDVFLLGTVLFIVSFGLYQLFIQPDITVPKWLRIENLDQLSERLIEVVGVLLAVTFLGFAVNLVASVVEALERLEDVKTEAEAVNQQVDPAELDAARVVLDQVSLIELGIAVAIVIAALSLLLVVSRRHAANHATAGE